MGHKYQWVLELKFNVSHRKSGNGGKVYFKIEENS